MSAVKTLPSADELARKFAASMLEDLGAEVLADCIALNKTPEYADCCATHDCCDSNMVMNDAFESFGIDPLEHGYTEEGGMSQEVVDLWNAAWELAKTNNFYV